MLRPIVFVAGSSTCKLLVLCVSTGSSRPSSRACLLCDGDSYTDTLQTTIMSTAQQDDAGRACVSSVGHVHLDTKWVQEVM
jgi:hypothetical protein